MSPTFGLMAPLLPPSKTIDVIVRLEALGWDRVWMPDHMLFPEPYLTAYDAWSVMAAAAARTSRIVLGTSVSDPHRIHPAVFAQRAATIDELSQGRLVIGLGAGEAMNLAPYGIPWNMPVSRLKEFVEVVYGVLEHAPFTFHGKFFQVENARLTVAPYRNRHIPLYLAALGPVTQRFAGERADGWIPAVVPASVYPELFRPVQEAAAGRNIEPCGVVIVAVTEDLSQVRRHLEAIGLTFVWPPLLRRLGVELTLPDEEISYTTVNPCDAASLARWEKLKRAVPIESLHRFVVHGTPDAIARQLGEYIAAGVRHFNLLDISPDPKVSMEVLAEKVFSQLREPRLNKAEPLRARRKL